jgi:hypothetical protein
MDGYGSSDLGSGSGGGGSGASASVPAVTAPQVLEGQDDGPTAQAAAGQGQAAAAAAFAQPPSQTDIDRNAAPSTLGPSFAQIMGGGRVLHAPSARETGFGFVLLDHDGDGSVPAPTDMHATVAVGTGGPPPPLAGLIAPYVPASDEGAEAVISMATLTPDDVVWDLGCGDGRLLIQAAQR